MSSAAEGVQHLSANPRLKTSVVIPVKNRKATIERCLSSLMPYYEQGHINEIVVVDAHSTDGTLEVVRGFPTKLLFDEGVRPYLAREMAWRKTSGELVLFMDADTYLGEGFFPHIVDLFQNESTGIISPHRRAVPSNWVSRTIGEWWEYHRLRLRGLTRKDPSSWSLFQRLYQMSAWVGEKNATTGGPCYIVRRDCLEAVDGFQNPTSSADILLSRRIIERGWTASWWLDAPLYHFPVTRFQRLAQQRHLWGETDAILHRNEINGYRRLFLLASRLGSPVPGLWLALRFRNPLHLLLFPLAHYAWLVGYVKEWLFSKQGNPE